MEVSKNLEENLMRRDSNWAKRGGNMVGYARISFHSFLIVSS